MSDISFVKMSGSGNDFVVVDNRQAVLSEEMLGRWSKCVCRRRTSIGADGVVLLENVEPSLSDSADFRWRYFNADGSEGEMCGNGAMCGAHVAFDCGIARQEMRFSTMSGIVSAEIEPTDDGSRVRLNMPDASPIGSSVRVNWRGKRYDFIPVDVGVPHVVAVLNDVDAIANDEFEELGRFVREHPSFQPRGTNVNVIRQLGGESIRMRTYERGVEAETLACGTGAVASGLIAVSSGWMNPPVNVKTSSGLILKVTFAVKGDRATDIRLSGMATEIARGVIRPGALTCGEE